MIKLFNAVLILFIYKSVLALELKTWPNYAEHRAQFLETVKGVQNYTVEMSNWPVKQESELSTAVAVLKSKTAKNKKIIVISSGIHGVEGQAGSSVQIALINEYLKTNLDYQSDFAYIHILNPWGMKYNRRVNADNIDLNRNFMFEVTDFNTKNDEYEKIKDFLNPTGALDLGFFHRPLFILDSISFILKYSMESLRQAILRGQYQFPQGIFFGGYNYSDLKTYVDHFIAVQLSNYEEIIWIDLHTSYGRNGQLHLLANDSSDLNSQKLQQLLPDEPIDFGQNKKFYKTTGDMISYLSHRLGAKRFTGLVFEYGTMDSQKALGSIESLRRMILENQTYFYNKISTEKSEASDLLIEMCNPQREEWWESVGEQSKRVFDKILRKTHPLPPTR